MWHSFVWLHTIFQVLKCLFQGAQSCANTGILVVVSSHLGSSLYPQNINFSELTERPRPLVLTELIIISLSRRIFSNITNTMSQSHCFFFMQSRYYNHGFNYIVRDRSSPRQIYFHPQKWLLLLLQPTKLLRRDSFNLDDLSWMTTPWMFNYIIRCLLI